MTAVTDQPTLLVNNLVRGTQEVTRLVITVPSDGFLQGHHIGLQGLQTAAQRRLAPSQLPCWAYRFNDRARRPLLSITTPCSRSQACQRALARIPRPRSGLCHSSPPAQSAGDDDDNARLLPPTSGITCCPHPPHHRLSYGTDRFTGSGHRC